MSFLSKLGEMAGKAVNYTMSDMNNKMEELNNAYKRAQEMDDETLIRAFKRESNTFKKSAYAKELKNRGYGSQN